MAVISFPASPTDGQEYGHNGVAYKYEASTNKWKASGAAPDFDYGLITGSPTGTADYGSIA